MHGDFVTQYCGIFATNVSTKVKLCFISKEDYLKCLYTLLDEVFKSSAILK
jgi:hypothetical protein